MPAAGRWFRWAKHPSGPLAANAVPSASTSSFSLSAYVIDVSNADTLTPSVTVVDEDGNAMAGKTVTYALAACAVSASQSTVDTTGETILNNGTATGSITLRIREADGTPIPDIASDRISVSSTGSNNTITVAGAASTNAAGIITYTIASTTAETKTISATVDWVAITDTASITFSGAGGSETDPLAMVPAGWSAVREWSNPASLTPTDWTISTIPTVNGTSTRVTTGYTGSPPIGGTAVREGTYYNNGVACASIGRIGTTFTASNRVAMVHCFQIPSTYPWSDVNGGNKVAFMPVGAGRVYTVWRAAYPTFGDDIPDRTNERKLILALDGFSPIISIEPITDATSEIELDVWCTVTVILDYSGGAGNGIVRYYLKKGTGAHVLLGERTDLTFPAGTISNGYMEHTNNGNEPGNLVAADGSLYDAYLGFFTP